MGNSEKESISKQITYEIFVQREAQLEVQSIFDYYEDLNEGLGFEFMRALDAALQTIKRNPLACQKIYQESRRVLLRKFPYAVFYLVEETRIVIIACFHQKRDPIDWIRRS
jgi:toxin ParE1/3/4